MKQLSRLVYYAFLLVIIIPFKIQSQNAEPDDKTKDKLMIAAREIMDEAGTCALITLNDESIPMVRIMDPFPPESDLTVWFGTNSKSRKVNQIKNNPNVTLYYQDRDASGYVVIHGKAQLINDEKEKEKRWKEAWEAFYPNQREGYLLIRVSPEWMEILSIPRGIVGDSGTWKTPIVRLD